LIKAVGDTCASFKLFTTCVEKKKVEEVPKE
jgi:hypothetical protein